MKTQPVRLFLCTVFIGVVLILLVMPQSGVASSQIRSGLTDFNNAQQSNTCQAILTRAIETLNSTCDKLDRNNACYGNNAVEAELNSTTIKFNTAGDRAPIRIIKRLVTSPLDTEKGTWGLSLLKLQANLPDTMPGQNVLFLVYGNTTIENTSGNMQAFYFTSGLGSPTCKEAPRDGILVRSPNHTEVTFTANGVQITIASTVILRAERNKAMDVLLVEGHARVTTSQGSQTLQPGQTVSVPLGGSTGLDPVSPPSAPVSVAADSTLPIILVSTEKFSPAHAPINVSVEGCITRAQGNTVTIEGQDIQYQSNDIVLRSAKVGDCVRVNGNLQSDNQGKSVIIAVPNTPKPPTAKPNAVQPISNGSNVGNPSKSNPVNNAGGSGGSSNNGGGSNGGGNSGVGNNNPVSSAGGGNNNSGGNGGNPSSNGSSNPDPVVHTPTPIPDNVPSGNSGTGGTAAPTTSTTNPGNNGSSSSPTAVGAYGGNSTNYTPAPAKDSTPSTHDKDKDGKGGNNNGNENGGGNGNGNGNNNGQNNNGNQGNEPNPAGPNVPPNNPSSPGTNYNNVPPNSPPGNTNPEPANNPAPANNPVSSNPVGAVSTP